MCYATRERLGAWSVRGGREIRAAVSSQLMSTDGLRIGVKLFPQSVAVGNSVTGKLLGVAGSGVKQTASMAATAPKLSNSVHIYLSDEQLVQLVAATAHHNLKHRPARPIAPSTFVREALMQHLRKLERRAAL
jgi:hypothetical protein